MWWLLLFVFLTWCVWVVACVMQKEVAGARRGLPRGKRGGVSAVPVIPLFPLAFWGTALLIDVFAEWWGTAIIGTLHAVFLLALIISIVRDWFLLRSLDWHG